MRIRLISIIEVARIPKREAASRETSNGPGSKEGKSKTVSNRRCNHPMPEHRACEHVPSLALLSLSLFLSSLSRATPRISHGIKPNPGQRRAGFHPPVYAVAASGSSVWTKPFIPPNFQPHRVYSTSEQLPNSQRSLSPHPVVPDHHLEQTPPGIHDQTPRAPSFLNILFTRRPTSSSSPPPVSLHHLTLCLFVSHIAPLSLSRPSRLPEHRCSSCTRQFYRRSFPSSIASLFTLHRPIALWLSHYRLFLSLIARIYLG